MGYLAQGLASLGHQVGIVTLSEKEGFNSGWNKNIRHYRLGARNNYDPRLLWKLYKLIRRVRPDIVHTWNTQTDILGGIAAIFNACLWVIREPNCADAYRFGWKSKFRARMGSKTDAIISNSAGGAEYWRSIYPHKRNYVISNGLPLREIGRVKPKNRQELGIEDGQKFILFAGRLRRQKGIDRIISALAMFGQQSHPVVFICGEGKQRDELQTMARRLGIENRIRFFGRLPAEELWAMMKSADLFVSLSDYEGMPNTVMEAMACGCPILISDIPAHREIMDETTGCLVNPQDKKMIWNKLSSLLSSQVLEANRNRALTAKEKAQSWSVEVMVKRYDKIYREMITGRIYE
jgi:glycosyltransferase involved in cell wall biosynthesis